MTTVVSEPHEMANVKGIRGILEMISAAKDAPIDIFYGIPSSVPSTSEKLETTGGVIDCSAMKHLLEEKDVVCVGEIMNYRQIIRENDLEGARLQRAGADCAGAGVCGLLFHVPAGICLSERGPLYPRDDRA